MSGPPGIGYLLPFGSVEEKPADEPIHDFSREGIIEGSRFGDIADIAL
jgi:hypothetical protein